MTGSILLSQVNAETCVQQATPISSPLVGGKGEGVVSCKQVFAIVFCVFSFLISTVRKGKEKKLNCPSCNTENPEGEVFCVDCGTELAPQEQQCPQEITENITPATESPPDPAALEEFKFLTLPKVPIKVSSAGATHVGLVKENNEDCYVVEVVGYPLHKIAVHVAIVADGMGGEAAGEVCGQIACHETWSGIRFLLPYFEMQNGFTKLEFWQFLNRQLEQHLPAQVASANTRVVRYGAAKKIKRGNFGATIVVAVIVYDLETGHVILHGYNEGDARCALVIGDQFQQLSHDHTIAGNPFRFLGRSDHISGQSFKWEIWMSEAEFQSFWMLLYSDGLWNMLSPEQISQICKLSQNPQEACGIFIDQTLRVETPYGKTLGDERVQTGDDNITITATRISTIKEN
jgi:serine/threonine protein phosphatase PrpC